MRRGILKFSRKCWLVLVSSLLVGCILKSVFHNVLLQIIEARLSIMGAEELYANIKRQGQNLSGTAGRAAEQSIEQRAADYAEENVRHINSEADMTWWQKELCPLLSFPKDSVQPTSKLKPGGNYIFMTETMCKTKIPPRQACAAESFSKHNPGKEVIFWVTSQRLDTSDPYVKFLLGLKNFQFVFLDMDYHFTNSPLRDWFYNVVWNRNTSWAYMNLADATRFLLVHEFGGVYMDTDFVSLRRLPSDKNWIGRQDPETIAAGAFHFEKNHEFIKRAITNFLENFNSTLWANNGPGVVTRVMKEFCQESRDLEAKIFSEKKGHKDRSKKWKKKQPKPEPCGGVKVIQPHLIYPLYYREWRFIFKPGFGERFLKVSTAYALHIWNKLSVDSTPQLGDGSIYDVTAKKFCPEVYRITLAANLTL
ncbi:alpha-1,4-N-acetylglucosaminyltransferase-like isoform X1 [Palaemon carinicauda]|uniref:alpha-1,4-N-acetylglucosaminyltransferase-like isoform X1 n=1 Tax=Palaemon carinicauda TaxID=392227 RepID=UPI0035B61ECF